MRLVAWVAAGLALASPAARADDDFARRVFTDPGHMPAPQASRRGPAAASAVKPKPSQGFGGLALFSGGEDDDDVPAQRPGRPQRGPGPKLLDGGGQPAIAPEAPPVVPFSAGFAAGSVVVDTRGRQLFYVLGGGQAYRYPISVGRIGFTWTGVERISRVASWPDWHPPAEMRQRDPSLPEKMTGGVRNPLGARALYLGNSLYRIHGTNDAKTIGLAASSGCFRMMNAHVTHLAGLAKAGTVVHVLASLPGSRTKVASGG